MIIEQDLSSNRSIHVNIKLLLATAWAFSMIVFAAIQLNLGADEKIVAMAFVALLFCALPFLIFGINDILAVFILGLLSKYSFFPLWIKTLFGERIDIGLRAPFLTYQIAMVGSIICCVALLLVKLIPGKRSLLHHHFNDRQMLLAGYLSTGIGLTFLTLHVFLAPVILPSGEIVKGFGGFGSLFGPLYFGIGCLTVASFKPNSNPIHKLAILLTFAIILVLSLQTNAKAELTFAVFSFALAILYFHIKIKAQYFLYAGVFVVFYLFVFAPVIHLTRTEAFKTADFSGKMAIIGDMFRSNSIRELDEQTSDIFRYDYYPSTHSFAIDRLEMIQDLDIAAGGITQSNTIQWIPVRWAVQAALPRFIVHDKSPVSDIDLIAYNAGFYPLLVTLNHTIGVFGSAYAMFLWPGLIYISLAILGLYLLMLRAIVSPELAFNVFGTFFIARYLFIFSEQSVQELLMAMMRFLPTDAILLLLISLVVVRLLPNTNAR